MLNLSRLAAEAVRLQPFPHLAAEGALDEAWRHDLAMDFPDPRKTGFFPVETLTCGKAFTDLIAEMRAPGFSKLVGEKLGLDLSQRPQMFVARRWSAARDGSPHTDGSDKVATGLMYFNEAWEDDRGALRFLEGPDLDGPGTEPVRPLFGNFLAFARSDRSWHGHPPFVGERRVLQVFWLKDADAMERKRRRHRRGALLKALWPFGPRRRQQRHA
jgi:SM-20-related protein